MTVDEVEAELSAFTDFEERAARVSELVQLHGSTVTQATLGRYSDDDYFDLDEVPPSCPWQVGSREPSLIIEAVFGVLRKSLPDFARALEETCHTVIARRTSNGRWYLLYYLERDRPDAMCVKYPGGSMRHAVYMGGAPNRAPAFGAGALAAVGRTCRSSSPRSRACMMASDLNASISASNRSFRSLRCVRSTTTIPNCWSFVATPSATDG